jgi:hypothetical protein
MMHGLVRGSRFRAILHVLALASINTVSSSVEV